MSDEQEAGAGRRSSRRSGGGASARRQARSGPGLTSLPYIHRQLEPTDVLTAEAVERTRSGRTGIYDIAVINQRGETVALFRGKSHTFRDRAVLG